MKSGGGVATKQYSVCRGLDRPAVWAMNDRSAKVASGWTMAAGPSCQASGGIGSLLGSCAGPDRPSPAGRRPLLPTGVCIVCIVHGPLRVLLIAQQWRL